jgi:acyl-CoA synthetase (AMP-forming)/AMP-acid ligase II
MARRVIESVGEVVQARATTHTDRAAFTFLTDGERDEQILSYGELDRRARRIAAKLQALLRPGDRVLLLCPPGLEFIEGFYGCLYAGAVAVPAYPPDPTAPGRIERIDAIARDCRPSAILSVQLVADARELIVRYAPALAELPIVTSQAEGPDESAFAPLSIGPHDMAFLQYTSGSTGNPKGVMLTHGNLLQNQEMIREKMPQDSDGMVVGWLPLFHDMGLIGLVNYTAYIGIRCVLMGPEKFLRRPMRWLEAASRYRATLTGAPNFGFDLCVNKSTPEERAALDLSSIEILFNGAEPIRAETLDRFATAFAPSGLRAEAFMACYGLAEATLMVAASPVAVAPRTRWLDPAALESGVARDLDGADARAYVSCGSAAGDQVIAIVDPASGTPCPHGHVGEVWISGPHVGQGYWDDPQRSEETFRARLDAAARTWLRTGDLGVLLDDELYVVGRLKDLLIVRGRNLAPQDLEHVAEEAEPSLRPGCSAVVQLEGPESDGALVAVHEFDSQRGSSSPEEAIAAVREAVMRKFGVKLHAVVLIAPRCAPKTSSGKIQRRACRTAYEQGTLREVVLDWNASQRAESGRQ